MIEKDIIPVLGNMFLIDITRKHCIDLLDNIVNRGAKIVALEVKKNTRANF